MRVPRDELESERSGRRRRRDGGEGRADCPGLEQSGATLSESLSWVNRQPVRRHMVHITRRILGGACTFKSRAVISSIVHRPASRCIVSVPWPVPRFDCMATSCQYLPGGLHYQPIIEECVSNIGYPLANIE
jgi:hypothetical protein